MLSLLWKWVAAGLAVALGLTVLFYEGFPIGPLRLIPVLGPALETITDGRVDRERKAGAAAEAARWEEAMRKLRLQLEIERAAAQDRIDDIERDYLARRQGDALAIAGLEQSLFELETANAENPAGARCVAIPRGVAVQLDKIGR